MSSMLLRLWLLVLLSLFASTAAAEVYRWTDAQGNVHYSDREPPQPAERVEVKQYAPAALPPAAAPAAQGAVPARAGPPPSIVMYLSPTCGYCTRAARFFDARGVPWRGEDITASQVSRLAFEQAGGRGTPLILVDGEKIHGFQKGRLDRLLASRGW